MATLTAGSFSGVEGYFAGSAGSLSPNTFGGFTCTAILTGITSGRISVIFSGNAVAFLTGKTITINGVPYSTVASGPTYDGSSQTNIEWTYGGADFVVGNVYTVDIGDGSPPFPGPAWVGKSTAASSAAAFNIDFSSSGRTAGDKLIIAVETANEVISTPSGFTQLGDPQFRGTAGVAGGVRLTLFEKVSTGSETTVSILDSGNHQYAVGAVFRGDGGVVADVIGGGNSAASLSGTFTGGEATADNSLIIQIIATDRDSTAQSWSSQTNANLANLTERHDGGTTTGVGGGIMILTGEMETAGPTGNTTATHGANVAYAWITLALKNVDGGDPPASMPYSFGFIA